MANKALNQVSQVQSTELANVKTFLAVMNNGEIKQMSKEDMSAVVGGLLPIVSAIQNGLMSSKGFIEKTDITDANTRFCGFCRGVFENTPITGASILISIISLVILILLSKKDTSKSLPLYNFNLSSSFKFNNNSWKSLIFFPNILPHTLKLGLIIKFI